MGNVSIPSRKAQYSGNWKVNDPVHDYVVRGLVGLSFLKLWAYV